jgi:hypothetical protein
MYKKISYFTFLLSLFSILFTACHKNTDIGLNIIPSRYILDPNALDTFTIEAYTQRVESMVTSGYYRGTVGLYIDDFIGTVKASFITEMRHSGENDFGTSPTIDSVVMYLKYNTETMTTYGKRNSSTKIRIYEIHDSLSLDANYHSDYQIDPSPSDLLAASSFVPAEVLEDTIKIKNDTMSATVAIRMDNSFGQRLIDHYQDWIDITFATYFKGFYFTSDTAESISIFDLSSASSKVTLYYSNTTDDLDHAYTFNFNTECTNFNIFEHTYDGPKFLPDLSDPDPVQDSVVYLQGASGLRAKIKIPYLDKLHEQGSWIVNQAKLIVQSESYAATSESQYPAPEQLVILAININDGDTTLNSLEDFTTYDQYGNLVYAGVEYNEGDYIFDITYFAQQVVNGKKTNNGLMIMLKDGAYNPSRVILKSGNHSNGMKLLLNITKI